MSDHTVIVGAGPAGLAVAAALGEQGVPYVLLERADSVGASWRGRYDSLRLHTGRRFSGLPGAPIPRNYGQWVRRDDLVAYLDDYVARFHVHPEFGVEVHRIERDPAGWRIETSAGTRRATTVVLATGHSRTPNVPDWAGLPTFPGPFSHSSTYKEPSAYRGKHVLVVGAGNSAAEIAVEVAEVAAEVLLSVRTPPNIIRRDVFGLPSQVLDIALRRVPETLMNPLIGVLRRVTVPDLGEYGLPAPVGDGFSQFLRSQTIPILDHGFVAAVRTGRIRVVAAVESMDGQDVRLADATTVRPDAIIAATGYTPDLGALVGDLGVLDESGSPQVHGAQTMTNAPGLYFVGIDVLLAGLLREIGREAGEVSRRVASALGLPSDGLASASAAVRDLQFVRPTPEPRGARMTSLIDALRRHRRLLTISGLSAAAVFLVLTGLDLLHLIGHGGAHISSTVKALVGLVMVVCVVLVMVLAVADNADEKDASRNPRVDR